MSISFRFLWRPHIAVGLNGWCIYRRFRADLERMQAGIEKASISAHFAEMVPCTIKPTGM
jgi:hypothetical protein